MAEPKNALSLIQLSDLFDHMPQAVLVADTDREIVYLNRGAEALFGYAADELVGMKTSVLYADAEEFAAQGQARYNAEAPPGTTSYRATYVRKDGTSFLGQTQGGPVRSADGSIRGFVGILSVASVMGRSLHALQRLHSITADSGRPFPERMQSILSLGSEYFGLPLAIQSRVVGGEYTVEHCMDPSGQLQAGAQFELAGTYCVHTLTRGGATGFHCAGRSAIREHPCYRDFGLESYLGAQVTVHGEVYGTINFSRFEACDPFSPDDLAFIELLADWVGNAIGAERARAQLQQAARTDVLTGLLNRRAVSDELAWQLAHGERSGLSVSVVMCDIDHFKRVNDTWGHEAGDEVLRQFAARATAVARQVDRIGRFGGEEFLFVLPDTDLAGAQVFAERLLAALASGAVTGPGGESIQISASFGAATAGLDESIDQLLARADGAMYEAKGEGRAQVRLAS